MELDSIIMILQEKRKYNIMIKHIFSCINVR